MKKRFLAALATGLFLVGMGGEAQALIIDYTKFNAEEVTTNIAEYKGFYPEFQLDQSVAGIRKNLEDAGYSCQAREY